MDFSYTFLEILAEQWLAPPQSPADLNSDDEVGTVDFALLANDWRQSGIALVINEFAASNNNYPHNNYPHDPQGEYDDWIEIYNVGHEAIDVSGMYLTDDLSIPTMWRIPDVNPSLTTIPGHGYLLIWADNDTGDFGLHANFELDTEGGQIGLFDTDGPAGGGLVDAVPSGLKAVTCLMAATLTPMITGGLWAFQRRAVRI